MGCITGVQLLCDPVESVPSAGGLCLPVTALQQTLLARAALQCRLPQGWQLL